MLIFLWHSPDFGGLFCHPSRTTFGFCSPAHKRRKTTSVKRPVFFCARNFPSGLQVGRVVWCALLSILINFINTEMPSTEQRRPALFPTLDAVLSFHYQSLHCQPPLKETLFNYKLKC